MPLRINTNVPGLSAQRALRNSTRVIESQIRTLSSGLRINRASDDAALLAVSESLRADISGFATGVRNTEQATNLTQVREGSLNEVSGLLVRMRELAVQASSDTLTSENRSAGQAEFSQLAAEIDRLSQSAPAQGPQSFQIGGNNTEADRVDIDLEDFSASGPAVNLGTTSIASTGNARQAISQLDQATNQVASQRADIGALQNRLAFSIRSNENALENAQASESTIRDADFAQEVTALTLARIRRQASTALLSQANLIPQRVLSFLQ